MEPKTVYNQLYKTIRKYFLYIFFIIIIGYSFCFPHVSTAKGPGEIFTLKKTIENAITASLEVKSSREGTRAADSVKKIQQTHFFPTLNATYQYTHSDSERIYNGITTPQDEYAFVTKFTQPLFSGFSLINQYKIASFGLDIAEINEKLVRQKVIFDAKNAFFSLLKAQKLLKVSQEAVTLLEAHEKVASNFYQVGMTPLNELLKAQVELANARLDLIIAQNNLEIAESNFNLILRRSINAPVQVEDVLSYSPFENDIDYCLSVAEKKRPEIKITDLEVEIAEKELKLEQKDYFPSINLTGSYYKRGTEWDVNGGDGISDPDGWDITAEASWNFWEWGRSLHGTKEKQSRLAQMRYRKKEIIDNIHLEVKQAYLKTRESEKNIITVEKAVDQAKESFRISEERYKEQMATSTDVLDARTLLSRTTTNYYNALYDFKIAKASLYRAIGQEVME